MKLIKNTDEETLTLTEQEQKDFQQKWKEHKQKYLKDHTIEDMVYENGSALALLYKEVQRLNSLLISNLQINVNED